jgi:hypothetical protein
MTPPAAPSTAASAHGLDQRVLLRDLDGRADRKGSGNRRLDRIPFPDDSPVTGRARR